MNNNDIKEKVFNIIKLSIDDPSNLEELKKSIASNKKFIESDVNSIFFIQLLVNCEKEFNIEFNDDELNMEEISSFNDLVKSIKTKIG